jgi:hypothetical protein
MTVRVTGRDAADPVDDGTAAEIATRTAATAIVLICVR